MAINMKNYSRDRDSEENFNANDKYDISGESEFSRESTIPFDEDEVLSERHYSFGPMEFYGRKQSRAREPRSEPLSSQNFRGVGPKNYKRTDEMIKENVSETLYRSTAVDASDIEVFVTHGTVTLKGSVFSRDQKKMAGYAIEHLAGVKDVFNELRVKKDEPAPRKNPNGLMDNITGMN
jgi:hypothetical protein